MYEVAIAKGIANKLNSGIVTLMVEDAPTLKSCAQYKNVFIDAQSTVPVHKISMLCHPSP
jgi:hypothetical protein